MAAPPKPDNSWRNLVDAKYYEEAPGPDCPHCNPELNPVQAEEGELADIATSPPSDARSTSAAAPPNDAPGTSQPGRRGRRRKAPTGKECKCFFCIPCKHGGLCVREFDTGDRPHSGHARLQIFRVRKKTCVRKNDMAGHLDTTSVMETRADSRADSHTMQRLCTVVATNSASSVMLCEGCQENVAKTTSIQVREENERNWRVCSIQCLLNLQERQVNRRKQLMPTRSPMQ